MATSTVYGLSSNVLAAAAFAAASDKVETGNQDQSNKAIPSCPIILIIPSKVDKIQ